MADGSLRAMFIRLLPIERLETPGPRSPAPVAKRTTVHKFVATSDNRRFLDATDMRRTTKAARTVLQIVKFPRVPFLRCCSSENYSKYRIYGEKR